LIAAISVVMNDNIVNGLIILLLGNSILYLINYTQIESMVGTSDNERMGLVIMNGWDWL